MKVEIEQGSNGFKVKYSEDPPEMWYIYKSTEDLMMIEAIVKRYLKRRIKAVEQ